jgi:hypothetical protein
MKVLEIKHTDPAGNILYREEGIKNLIHYSGEQLILSILFGGVAVPENYYIGLDSRNSLSASSTIGNISGFEPTTGGYSRQGVDSSNFSVISAAEGWQANSPVLLFSAVGGSWGPVKNIFMTTGLGYSASSTLISSASLSREIIVSAGEVVTMRMAMALSEG